MIYCIVTVLFFAGMLAYFRIADHFNIIDHPNERSSHSTITIRGGGAIFILAAVFVVVLHPDYWLLMAGIFIIGAISFLDDILTLSSRIRLLFHLIAVTFAFYYLNIYAIEYWYICIMLYIMVIGVINMYNFMDGINGITGLYSLIVLGGMQYVNLYKTAFVDRDILWLPMLACCAFLYFNFRKKARCFAGDVGSITIAFWIIMLLMHLILVTNNWSYILFLVVYGVDSVATIAHRLLLKQNILKAHRLHFYQILVNDQKLSHLWVAAAYALLQGIIILIIVSDLRFSTHILFLITIVPLAIVYIMLKPILMKR